MDERVQDPVADSPLTFALQALLARHEAYMADAERDRLELTERIERLELDKHELEAENARKIEENRQLLDQLELVNTTVTESDTKIRSLEASLLSSQQTIRRLEAAAARAEDAERHLAVMEEEQVKLHSELRLSKEDARTHSQRCKEAQRGILDMQDQLDRMEKEAREERERHVEVMGRMERQREVEKQLDTAAGRLKGAAAYRSMGVKKDGSSVVNHFVRDLLQDNANLQLGIAELKEMLMNSNDEIQSLRGQMIYHQPAGAFDEDAAPLPTLREELEPKLANGPKFSQELHIHHHYHTPKQEVRRPRRKRQGIAPGAFYPPSFSSPASTRPPSVVGSTVSINPSQVDGDPGDLADPESPSPTPHATNNRSGYATDSATPSEFASSLPSSPHSHRVSSLFDTTTALDVAPPTSPTSSFDPTSPTWRSHRKRTSGASYQSIQSLQMGSQTDAAPDMASDWPTPQKGGRLGTAIQEEDEESQSYGTETAPGNHYDTSMDKSPDRGDVFRDGTLHEPRLRRVVSHDSIMSLQGGLDIHTLKARPSQMTLRPIGGLEAVVTGVTAQPTLLRSSSKRSDVALRDQVSRAKGARPGPRPPNPAGASNAPPAPQRSLTGGLGKLVGWRPWAGLTAGAGAAEDDGGPDKSTGSPAPDKGKDKAWSRTPGINQPGSIPGFQQYWASQKRKGAPAKVNPETIDHEALSEGLQE